MADSFFSFNTDLPGGVKALGLGQGNLDDEFLTDNIEEEEYDALNDETFGLGADDGDWEEDHEKLSGLITKSKNSDASFFEESVYEDENQHEILSKSISQLGLEDDLDDPAIMTVGHSHSVKSFDRIFRSSPPPPAILDPEFCGSPKTHSIWSTTPTTDSHMGPLLQSISPNPLYQHSSSYNSCSDVFHSPSPAKAWTLEEVERNILFSEKSQAASGSTWSPIPLHTFKGNHLYPSDSNGANNSVKCNENIAKCLFENKDKSNVNNRNFADANSISPSLPLPVKEGVRTLDDVEKDILLPPASTVEEVERHLQSNASVPNHITYDAAPSLKPLSCRAVTSPIGIAPGPRAAGPFHSTPPPAAVMPALVGERASPNILPGFPRRLIYERLPAPIIGNGLDPRLARLRYPMPGSVYFPFPVPPNSPCDPRKLNIFSYGDGKDFAYPCPVSHPFLQKMQNRRNYTGWNTKGPDACHRTQSDSDEYAGLMTQREKEWLIKIQLMLLKADNPYVEDYYYTTYSSRKVTKGDSENESNGPKLLLPERSKHETKTYVPTQFEGSLGKLQAVSVNFPRKVLDIIVSRPLEDEEGRVVTYQSRLKYRRLLLDIEKMYNYILEIDDEEKRILALPDEAHSPHLETISKLTEKIMTGLSCESAAMDDTFQNVMIVRKGRNLAMRAFKKFSQDQKISFLAALFRCLPPIIRKDQNDLILLKNYSMIFNVVSALTLPELVLLGESLENLPHSDAIINLVREKSNYICAFKNKFGSSIVCAMLHQAENTYSDKKSSDSEVQAKWTRVIIHVADILCTLPDSAIVPPLTPTIDLLTHFQRFPVDRDKFEVLKKKLLIFQHDPLGGGDTCVTSTKDKET